MHTYRYEPDRVVSLYISVCAVRRGTDGTGGKGPHDGHERSAATHSLTTYLLTKQINKCSERLDRQISSLVSA